jgi:hypothetical protein
MTTFEDIQAAFAKELAEDCQREQPAVQLMPDEQASLVALLGKVLDGLPATATAPTSTVRKRARSAYQFWKSNVDVKAAFREEHPHSDGPTTNKLMGQIWKNLSDEEKAPFEAESASEKEQFQSREPKTNASPKKSVSKKCPNVRKRARSAYQIYKKDENVRKVLREAMPDADFTTFSKALSIQWKELSEVDSKPFYEAAKLEKAEMDNTSESEGETTDMDAPETLNVVLADVAQILNEAPEETTVEASEPLNVVLADVAQILNEAPEETTVEAPEEIRPKKKRGSSPYQQWKKEEKTKNKFITEHPEVLDKKEMNRLLKIEWESMEGDNPQEKLDIWKRSQGVEE